MSGIDKLLDGLKDLLEDLQKQNIFFKVSVDRDGGIVRLYGEDSHYVNRASSGLEEVMELAYTTAEHHPYWAVLYNAVEICKTVLERWDSEFSADQISEMSWRTDEIKMALRRLDK